MKYRLAELSDSDAQKWDELTDPLEFIHNALNQDESDEKALLKAGAMKEEWTAADKTFRKPTKTPAERIVKTLTSPEFEKAEHTFLNAVGGDNKSQINAPVIKTSKDAEKAVKNHLRGGLGDYTAPLNRCRVCGAPKGIPCSEHMANPKLCKIHGTPLTEDGKCLQKGH